MYTAESRAHSRRIHLQFTIKNSSSGLERRINRWAADTLSSYARSAPAPPPGTDAAAFAHLALVPLAEALFADIDAIAQSPFLLGLAQQGFDYPGLGIVVQSLLRHVMSSMLADGIVNQLLVTNSNEANMELTKLHEQLFNRESACMSLLMPLSLTSAFDLTGEPLVASVWRRQTFSAAVESLSPTMSLSIFQEHMPALFALINPSPVALSPPLASVLEASYTYSRMLHASHSPMGGGAIESSGFYRAYCPVIGSQLDPTQLGEFMIKQDFRFIGAHSLSSFSLSLTSPELIKKCYRCERGTDTTVVNVSRERHLADPACVSQANPNASERVSFLASSKNRPSTPRHSLHLNLPRCDMSAQVPHNRKRVARGEEKRGEWSFEGRRSYASAHWRRRMVGWDNRRR